MSDNLKSLDGTLVAVWEHLQSGVDDPDAPARNVVLATASLDGGGAVRTVVLRGVDRDAETLTFFTHRASSKVAELSAEPKCEALIWDAKTSFQIRLRMTAEVRDGPEDIWNQFGPGTRRNYALSQVPGAVLDTPEDYSPEVDASQFMVISATISSIETLHLGSDFHRRARFTPSGAEWIAP